MLGGSRGRIGARECRARCAVIWTQMNADERRWHPGGGCAAGTAAVQGRGGEEARRRRKTAEARRRGVGGDGERQGPPPMDADTRGCGGCAAGMARCAGYQPAPREEESRREDPAPTVAPGGANAGYGLSLSAPTTNPPEAGEPTPLVWGGRGVDLVAGRRNGRGKPLPNGQRRWNHWGGRGWVGGEMARPTESK